ncbi:3'-5' RNA exonuclease complex component [Coemansia guatemalensis]|uniref:3'-5' RNA exonuclease complex component n=1 Tax=Coemansia guatemalensis TaxID=2761395 RepID=A0A9W8HWQ7_9FUNG|nr:3'-5' RNA exonuclease complex component [Coemansia guatemalensis]
MQSSLYSKAFRLRPRISQSQFLSPAIRYRYAAQRYTHSDGSASTNASKLSDLESIVGKPAKTFDELVGQLEILINHPNPPRNYADALAKEEIHEAGVIDLSTDKESREKSKKAGLTMRQRPRHLRYSPYIGGGERINTAAAYTARKERAEEANANTKSSGKRSDGPHLQTIPSDVAINLGISEDQRRRQRMWMNKITGYRNFRDNLLSMDRLMDVLERSRASDNASDSKDGDPPSEDVDGAEQSEASADRSDKPLGTAASVNADHEFEELLDHSWKLFDEDYQLADDSPSGDVEKRHASGGTARSRNRPSSNTPPGTRSFHTSRSVLASSKPNPRNATVEEKNALRKKRQAKHRKQTVTKIFKFSRKKIGKTAQSSGSGTEGSKPRASRVPQSLIKLADLPTTAELQKHITEGQELGTHVHIPIAASVKVGDIVELHTRYSSMVSSPFATVIQLGGIIIKSMGRFHFSILTDDNIITNAREGVIGFVASGLIFDEEFLRKGGVPDDMITRILRYGERIREHEAVNGEEALTDSNGMERLKRAQLQVLPKSIRRNSLEDSQDDSEMDVGDTLDSGMLSHQSLTPGADNASTDITSTIADTVGINGADDVADVARGEGDEEEEVLDAMLRVIPRAIRIFKAEAEQLLRTHYREFGGYWAMATAKGQKRVTVNSLAELIYGDDSGKPISQAARLAAFMHLIQNPQHFVPAQDFLFVDQSFELRPYEEVKEFDHVRNMVRQNAPEFKRFIDKARKLVAYSYEREPQSPAHAALSPDEQSARRSMTCDITGWSVEVGTALKPVNGAEPAPSKSYVEGISFDASDQKFINILCKFVHHSNIGYEHMRNPYDKCVSPILKKMDGRYNGGDASCVTRFLVDIGVWPQWHNPMLDMRSIPYGSAHPESKMSQLESDVHDSAQRYLAGDPASVDTSSQAAQGGAVDKTLSGNSSSNSPKLPWWPDYTKQDSVVTRSSSGTGVIDKTQFYGRDICEDIRHDFGNIPVYTIDSSSTQDVDDGVSIETICDASGAQQKWIHIHVADPTAIIHPGHIAVDSAALGPMTSLYYVEKTKHMLPIDLVKSRLSLVRRANGDAVKTMTFSARIGENGDIVDYKVCPGLVRNIIAAPYELVDKYMDYGNAATSVKSLANIQDNVRQSTLIHPFAPTEEDWRPYGEGCGTLPETDVQKLRAIQKEVSRHMIFRWQCGCFTNDMKELDVSINLDAGPQTTSMDYPKFLYHGDGAGGRSFTSYPTIRQNFASMYRTPAHALVGELMVIAGQVATRYAYDRDFSGTRDKGVNSSGVITGRQGIPLLYRVQQTPRFGVLRGCSPDLPLAFDNLTMEEAQSAKNVWDAMLSVARANHGIVDNKSYDEVRHMQNPSIFSEDPGVHTIMGIMDRYGYARVTSPIRRLDDMIVHWQLKAQLLAEHGDARDKSPWFWKHYDMALLAPVAFRKNFAAGKCMTMSMTFWAFRLAQRMESEARRGTLQPPPEGFYNTSSPRYYDTPWAYYSPHNVGPLIWTAIVDNRDETRSFISLIIECLGVRAMLLPRPQDSTLLPFAGTKVRVQIVSLDPVAAMALVKLAPEEYQPAETPRFWRKEYVTTVIQARFSAIQIPPEESSVRKTPKKMMAAS